VALIVLVGLPGSGKTTTGRALAQTLGRGFVDTDEVFFDREQMSVQDYLRSHGEAQFRERELLVLSQALGTTGVVSTGAGAVTTAPARRLLGKELTVWLECPDEVLVARVLEGDRPLLGDDPAVRLRELRAQRDALYLEVSRFRVNSSQPMDRLIMQLASIVETTQASS
jgi:shikimate kinase